MKSGKRNGGMTLLEVVLVLAVLAVLVVLFMPALSRARVRVPQTQCLDNLRQLGLSFQIWEGDHSDYYPMFTPQTNGGSMEFSAGPEVWRHYQVMSNELMEPKILICPAETDRARSVAVNFDSLRNSNLSFFVGSVSNELDAEKILAGDRNITNGKQVCHGSLELTFSQSLGWTTEMHRSVGNILLADGSARQVDDIGLRAAIANPRVQTNRVQLPVLEP
jgi:prepilin-type N-terminal cleavage/methylation domain-containing protein